MIKEKLQKENISLPETFSVGYARKAVNPECGIGIGGWGSEPKRVSEEIWEDICVTCTAISDGEEVALLYTTDILHFSHPMYQRIAAMAEERFGIDPKNVICSATHTHSGPGVHRGKACPGLSEYEPIFYGGMEEVTEAALRDLAPARVFMGLTRATGMNYVRRYLSREDGRFLGNWLNPAPSPEEAMHETEADAEMRALRFVREEKKDVVLCNWQCHPCSPRVAGEFATHLSPDWIAPFREIAEKELDVHFAFHQGACGNLISTTSILNEKNNSEYKRKGRELAYHLAIALKGAKQLETGPIHSICEKIPATIGLPWKEKSGEKADTYSLQLTTVSFGDFAIATAPCEWHDTCGRAVREGSPFKMTFICGYTNGSMRYIPAAFCWNNGGYEVKSCFFVAGTGEQITRHHADKLWELYPKRFDK